MTDDLVLYETDDNIAIVTMNRPEKLNAISHDLRSGVSEALLRADEDKAVNVVILRSEGRSFCVGYDIDNDTPERAARRFDALKWHESLSEDMRFETIPWYLRKPVIASVQGHALGGGCELAMFCDITIAADNALFGEPEIHFSNVGPAIVMPWIIGFKKARELLYLGDMIDAETALDLGMVNRVVPLDELRERTLRFARRMALIAAKNPPLRINADSPVRSAASGGKSGPVPSSVSDATPITSNTAPSRIEPAGTHDELCSTGLRMQSASWAANSSHMNHGVVTRPIKQHTDDSESAIAAPSAGRTIGRSRSRRKLAKNAGASANAECSAAAGFTAGLVFGLDLRTE